MLSLFSYHNSLSSIVFNFFILIVVDIPITTMADDWQIGKTLSDRLQHMLKHQLMCDVTFHVGSTQTPIKSHKFMLVSASPVFYSMFDGPMAENGDVSIPDIEADVFNDILT